MMLVGGGLAAEMSWRRQDRGDPGYRWRVGLIWECRWGIQEEGRERVPAWMRTGRWVLECGGSLWQTSSCICFLKIIR